MKARMLSIIFTASLLAQLQFGQTLPKPVRRYLDRNFSGWKLAGECFEKANTRILVGDFDGNKSRDYVVKFARGDKGFMMAFLASHSGYKPFYLHLYSAKEAKGSDLLLVKRGETFEMSLPGKLNNDAPADFLCESDSGGIHVYRNGKFIAY